MSVVHLCPHRQCDRQMRVLYQPGSAMGSPASDGSYTAIQPRINGCEQPPELDRIPARHDDSPAPKVRTGIVHSKSAPPALHFNRPAKSCACPSPPPRPPVRPPSALLVLAGSRRLRPAGWLALSPPGLCPRSFRARGPRSVVPPLSPPCDVTQRKRKEGGAAGGRTEGRRTGGRREAGREPTKGRPARDGGGRSKKALACSCCSSAIDTRVYD